LPVKEELKQQGEAVIDLMVKFATRCDEIVVELGVGNEINWDKEALLIEKRAQRVFAKKTAKELVVAACKEMLQDICHGARDLDFPIEIMRKYMWNLYVAKFDARVLLTKKHHNNVDAAYVRARLEGMRGYVWANLVGYARQAVNRHSFASLRRSSRQGQSFNADNLDIVLAH
ncbi:MAG TPA: hypothetical protein VEP90_25680, partial [Methylomirabilota bacterium]|nr:hypothetical protein [Methylomirabilota bacterium]